VWVSRVFGKLKKKLGKVFGGIGILGLIGVFLVIVILLLAVAPFIFMLAWNAVMPSVFNLPKLDFWMSLGAVILLGFLGSVFHK
jgi:hypothetical protein